MVHCRYLSPMWESSVADPDPSDPYVFGPPGSVSQRSGTGSVYHQAKIARKTLFCDIFLTFYLWKWCKCTFKRKKHSFKKKIIFFSFLLVSWRSMTKIAGSASISQRNSSADPDPYQNVMDPQHCRNPILLILLFQLLIPCFFNSPWKAYGTTCNPPGRTVSSSETDFFPSLFRTSVLLDPYHIRIQQSI